MPTPQASESNLDTFKHSVSMYVSKEDPIFIGPIIPGVEEVAPPGANTQHQPPPRNFRLATVSVDTVHVESLMVPDAIMDRQVLLDELGFFNNERDEFYHQALERDCWKAELEGEFVKHHDELRNRSYPSGNNGLVLVVVTGEDIGMVQQILERHRNNIFLDLAKGVEQFIETSKEGESKAECLLKVVQALLEDQTPEYGIIWCYPSFSSEVNTMARVSLKMLQNHRFRSLRSNTIPLVMEARNEVCSQRPCVAELLDQIVHDNGPVVESHHEVVGHCGTSLVSDPLQATNPSAVHASPLDSNQATGGAVSLVGKSQSSALSVATMPTIQSTQSPEEITVINQQALVKRKLEDQKHTRVGTVQVMAPGVSMIYSMESDNIKHSKAEGTESFDLLFSILDVLEEVLSEVPVITLVPWTKSTFALIPRIRHVIQTCDIVQDVVVYNSILKTFSVSNFSSSQQLHVTESVLTDEVSTKPRLSTEGVMKIFTETKNMSQFSITNSGPPPYDVSNINFGLLLQSNDIEVNPGPKNTHVKNDLTSIHSENCDEVDSVKIESQHVSEKMKREYPKVASSCGTDTGFLKSMNSSKSPKKSEQTQEYAGPKNTHVKNDEQTSSDSENFDDVDIVNIETQRVKDTWSRDYPSMAASLKSMVSPKSPKKSEQKQVYTEKQAFLFDDDEDFVPTEKVNQTIKVTLTPVIGDRFEMKVSQSQSALDVKKFISQEKSIDLSKSEIRLYHGKTLLEDDSNIFGCNIYKNPKLHYHVVIKQNKFKPPLMLSTKPSPSLNKEVLNENTAATNIPKTSLASNSKKLSLTSKKLRRVIKKPTVQIIKKSDDLKKDSIDLAGKNVNESVEIASVSSDCQEDSNTTFSLEKNEGKIKESIVVARKNIGESGDVASTSSDLKRKTDTLSIAGSSGDKDENKERSKDMYENGINITEDDDGEDISENLLTQYTTGLTKPAPVKRAVDYFKSEKVAELIKKKSMDPSVALVLSNKYWKNLDPKDKSRYVDMEEKDKARYKLELNAFRRFKNNALKRKKALEGKVQTYAITETVQSVPEFDLTKKTDPNKKRKRNITKIEIDLNNANCLECINCRKQDCGSCLMCIDKIKFGGPNKKKQRCLERTCLTKKTNRPPQRCPCEACLQDNCGDCSNCKTRPEFGGKSYNKKKCLSKAKNCQNRCYKCKTNHNHLFCCKCKKTFATTDQKKDHSCLYYCEKCGKGFSTKQKLERHMVTHINENKSKKKPPVTRKHGCDKCAKAFTTKWKMERHKRTVHEKNRDQFVCDICHKSFAKFTTLTDHKKCHTRGYAYCCPLCDKKLSSRESFALHPCVLRNIDNFKGDLESYSADESSNDELYDEESSDSSRKEDSEEDVSNNENDNSSSPKVANVESKKSRRKEYSGDRNYNNENGSKKGMSAERGVMESIGKETEKVEESSDDLEEDIVKSHVIASLKKQIKVIEKFAASSSGANCEENVLNNLKDHLSFVRKSEFKEPTLEVSPTVVVAESTK